MCVRIYFYYFNCLGKSQNNVGQHEEAGEGTIQRDGISPPKQAS
jgi:hypothetical protein